MTHRRTAPASALATLVLAATLFAWVAHPTHGEDTCPVAALDIGEEGRLIDALRDAENAAAARDLNASLWKLWTKAPDAHAQNLLDSAMARIRMGDLSNAVAALDGLVAYCPDYAEGYNQRAFARYLQQDFGTALTDLDRALELSPRHIGALSGKALTLIGLGEEREALAALRDALALNPWLSERALLDDLERKLGATDL
jgi:tetratricopeptide (TPR) repeat protein